MIAAKLINNIVVDVFVVSNLDDFPDLVACPEWVGIGMDINTPKPDPEPIVDQPTEPFV